MDKTNTAETETLTPEQNRVLEKYISRATPEQIDILWSILKYKEIRILRKIKCMASTLNANLQELSNIFPKDQEGRILDYKTRHAIHDVLICYS